MGDVAINEKDLQVQAQSQYEQAMTLKVEDVGSMEIAGIVLKAIDDFCRKAKTFFEPMLDRAREAKRAAEANRKEIENKLEEMTLKPMKARGYLLKQINDFRTQEQKRRDEEARAEQDRLQKIEEEKRLKEAEELEAKGEVKKAEQLMNEEIVTPVVTAEKLEKPIGVASREVWKFKITDFSKLPDEFKKPDEVKIGGIVRAMKDKANIPGVEAYAERTDYTRG